MRKLAQQLTLDQLQNLWASALNPILANPIVNGRLVQDQSLTIGTTAVEHKLGRKPQGWMVVGINGIAEIYDTQATNQLPHLFLNLVSDANVSVNLWVF